jgi:hypothetical protein
VINFLKVYEIPILIVRRSQDMSRACFTRIAICSSSASSISCRIDAVMSKSNLIQRLGRRTSTIIVAHHLFLVSGSGLPISTVMPSRISSICSFMNACTIISMRLDTTPALQLEVVPMRDEVLPSSAAIARLVGTEQTCQHG